MSVCIRKAVAGDENLVVEFIFALAKYEKLEHEVKANKEDITRDLFGPSPRVF